MVDAEELTAWRLVRTSPGAAATPAELSALGLPGLEVVTPSPVGALLEDSPWAGCDVDAYDWWQSATLTPGSAALVRFDGITCPATIFADQVAVAEVESMFLPMTVTIPAGTEHIHVRFDSVTRWLRTRRGRGRWRSTLVAAQGLRWLRTSLIGRSPVYGDLPPIVGIWQPVHLHRGPVLDDVSVTTKVDGRVAVNLRLVGADDTRGTVPVVRARIVDDTGIEVAAASSAVGVGTTAELRMSVRNPVRWWPAGYGPAYLYRLIIDVDGRRAADRPLGFRDVTVDRSDGGFTLCVNGVEVFCRGATWAPLNAVRPSADDPESLTRVVGEFAAAGATMLRLVGGLVPEQPEFYDLCAQAGILIWHDAMQATFDPPEEISRTICAEVGALVDRLSGNPALTVLSGGSETQQQPQMLGVDAASRRMPILDELLPAMVADHSDAVFVQSSPTGAAPSADDAIDPASGVAHWFGVGGYLRPIEDVYRARVRFAAESLAFAIPPDDATIERDFGSLTVVGHHPWWKAGVPRDRTASWDFEDVRDHYVRAVFDVDPLAIRRVDPARYLQLGRVAISAAMECCYRYWRRADSRCAGALVLSGKDMVPGAGWGLLGADGSPKLPLSVLRRVWAPVAVLLSDDGLSGLRVDVYNDGPTPLDADLTLHVGQHETHVEPVALAPHSALHRSDQQLTGTFTDLSHAYRFGPAVTDAVEVRLTATDGTPLGRDVLVVTPPRSPVRSGLHGRIRPDAAGADWIVTVCAPVSLRYVCLDAPGYSMSDNCFGLVGGIGHDVRVTATSTDRSRRPPRIRISSVDALDSPFAEGPL